jgi:hypothetical protein
MTDVPVRIGPVLRELRRSDPRDYHNSYRYRRHPAEALRRAQGLLARLMAAWQGTLKP